ncbi:MAG TPA: queuosine salvage family protein [Anaerolineae bacterium]|nr:queuosine salvage family protein [Anaerolineae bacterium]HOQ98113.1 queuosine salvage family protein [Anaerolineae bacterium]HPL27859.1 queuosine salvage family protein [Anaerolineae bacterium]
MSLLDQVRAGCAAVAARARFVHIDEGRIAPYATSLPLEQAVCPAIDPATHYLGHGDDTVAFLLTLDAINFGSGYFPRLKKRPGLSGYFTVAASLNDHYRAHGPLSAAQLAALSAADCARIFGQDPADPAIAELMQHFAVALGDLGRTLLERYGGSFRALVEAAGGSAERLAELLAAMPYFNDIEVYDGQEVPFFKRAQLAAADLAVAFDGQGLGHFTDLERLTIFADNLVPHVLRVDGVLHYQPDVAARIDREELIPAGSPEEVEIRAGAVHAVELMVAALHTAGERITAHQLDYLLWNRGHEPLYKARPRHRTRTVYY